MHFEKVLVTGGSGRLGRFVVDELAERCEVSVLDLDPPARGVRFIVGDILDLERVRSAVQGVEAIVHLAAIDDGRPFPDVDFFRTNVQGTWHVLHAAEAAGLRKVVVASSIAALGLGWDGAPDYLPVDEAHPLRPKATYSLTKQVIEVVSESFVARGALNVTCLRPTLVVRPEAEAAILAQLALDDPDAEPPPGEGGGVKPYGALSATRSYVRSRDAARAFVAALDFDARRYSVFNVSAADTIGRVRTLERMAQVYGAVPEVRDAKLYQRDPHASVLDISRIGEELGWRPEGDWTVVERAQGAAGAEEGG